MSDRKNPSEPGDEEGNEVTVTVEWKGATTPGFAAQDAERLQAREEAGLHADGLS